VSLRKLYSQMTLQELEAEMKLIRAEMDRVEFPSQRSVLERKYFMALAYTIDPADFPPGLYKVEHIQQPFELRYINGIMAWGTVGEEEASYPISMLTRL
jgi:hypothetical protein